MNKQAWTVSKLNLSNIRTPYFVTGLVFMLIFAQSLVYMIVSFASGKAGGQLNISSGNYIWLLMILAAIFIPARNFRKMVNLGAKREGIFQGGAVTYAALAGFTALANTALFYTVERFLIGTGYYAGFEAFMRDPSLMDHKYISVNLIELFGWSARGPGFAIAQQFAFLMLLAAAVHTLTAMQDKWYGWVTDLAIAAILSVFIPIAPLRAWLVRFFDLILFNANPFMQISVCLLLAAAVYALSKPIFARKVI